MAILAPPQDVSGFDASAVTYTGVWVADAQIGFHNATNDAESTNPASVSFVFRGTQANASGIMAINDAPLLGMLIPIDGSTPSVSINQSTHGHGEPIIITTTPKRSCATYNLTLTLGAQQTMKLANFSFEPCIAPSVTLAGSAETSASTPSGGDRSSSVASAGSGPGGNGGAGLSPTNVGLVVVAAGAVVALLIVLSAALYERRRRRLRKPNTTQSVGNTPSVAESLEPRLQSAARLPHISTFNPPPPTTVQTSMGRLYASPVLDISSDSVDSGVSSAGAATRYSRSTIYLPLLPPPVIESKFRKVRK